MSYNNTLLKPKLSHVTKKLFKEALFVAYKGGITSVAPLGFSGDTIMLYAKDGKSRNSQVSIRNYGNDAELLITDKEGHFLFYGRFHISMGVSFVIDQYWAIFKSVKHMIEKDVPQRPDFANLQIPHNCSRTIGFDMLLNHQRACGGFL